MKPVFVLMLSFFFVLLLVGAHSKKIRAHDCVRSKNCESHDFEEIPVGLSHSREKITLSFAVKLKNVDKLYQLINQVSDPSSSKYGKHLTYDEMGELTSDLAATERVRTHLLKFVDSSKISSSRDGTFVRVKTDIKTAEKILNSSFQKFRSPKTGELVSRTLEFELPDEVGESVDYVSPTIQFPATLVPPAFVTSTVTQEIDEEAEIQDDGAVTRGIKALSNAMTPTLLKSFYNITSNFVTNPGATQSIYATGGQSFLATDLGTFQRSFGLPVDKVDTIIGKNRGAYCRTDANACLEASLDLQYLMSTAQNAPTTFWSTKVADFARWIEDVSSSINPPLVHSVSYGLYELGVEAAEQQRFSQEAARLGARGVTIVAATGDDGVSLYGARTNPSWCGFRIPYPANVPYVLSVGATMGPESGSNVETACSTDKGSPITTGGGFSSVFSQPGYQSAHVQNYFSKVRSNPSPAPPFIPTSTMFHANGRAIPDVAMTGNKYQVIINKRSFLVSGTSASAPVFAGILTLANDARLNLGKSSLGFVNPALYSLYNTQPELFNDITIGDNRCTAQTYPGATAVCCQYGFTCQSGWDPVTGLGSVNAGRLIQALVNL